MTDRKQELAEAIIKGDMEGVRKYYTWVYSEPAPQNAIPVETGEGSTKELDNFKAKTAAELSSLYWSVTSLITEVKDNLEIISDEIKEQENSQCDIDDIDDDNDDSDNDSSSTSKTTVDPKTGMEFYTAEVAIYDNDPEYKEKMKKLSKGKTERRDEYTPMTKSCSICGKEFDFNQVYPAGVVDGRAKKNARCAKCQGKT